MRKLGIYAMEVRGEAYLRVSTQQLSGQHSAVSLNRGVAALILLIADS